MSKPKIKNQKPKAVYIIGIDEAGRGCLAGPVVVATTAATTKFKISNLKLKLRDSKKLTPKQREIWFRYIKQSQKSKTKGQRLCYATASVSPKIIDKINIANAANLAATSALRALIKNCKLRIKNCRVYLDGGLFLNSEFCILNSTTVVRGDEKIPAIMLASIIAKVSRDRLMLRLHKKYSQYSFNEHKGYATKKHIKAIKKYGRLPIHRKSFRIK